MNNKLSDLINILLIVFMVGYPIMGGLLFAFGVISVSTAIMMFWFWLIITYLSAR